MKGAERRRALCIGVEADAFRANGWMIMAGRHVPDSVHLEADCLIVSATTVAVSALAELQRRHNLPIVAFVAAEAPVDWGLIDACDACLFAGDDPATAGHVLDGVALASPDGVRDLSDNTARAIGALSAEASRIAEALQSLVAREVPAVPQPVSAAMVRRLIKLRRDRDRYLPALLFADPAWDMLLDLTAARLERRDVPVSSLCIAGAVPTTTGLRWIRTLTEAGLFERHSDPGDARRNFVRLTDAAADAMFGWLRAFIGVFGTERGG